VRICIFGAGAIGGMIGSLLKKNGVNVTLIARGEHYSQIKKNGLVFKSKEFDLDICQKFDIQENIDNLGHFDLLINGLKAHSANSTAEHVSKLMHKNSIILPTLNGVPWWFFYKHQSKYKNYILQAVDPNNKQWDFFKPSRVIGCVVYPAAIVKAPGIIEHIEGRRLILGEPDDAKTERIQALSKTLISAGIKAPISKNIRSDIWLKLIGNSSFNPLSIITKSTLKEMCEAKETRNIVFKMMTEANTISKKLNIPIKLDIEKRIEGARLVGNHKTSTLQDYENKKPLELDALIKSLVELGELTNTEVPTIKTIYQLAKFLEDKNN